jgi:hypothetical protein
MRGVLVRRSDASQSDDRNIADVPVIRTLLEVPDLL